MPKKVASPTRQTGGPKPVSASKRPVASESVELSLDQIATVFGDSGTARWGGFYNEEFNPEFRNRERIELIERMRRGDGAVKAVLHAIKSPLLATNWSIDCADEKIKEFSERCLFRMKRSWNDFLREALAYLDFGHYVFEKIYDIEDGLVVLRDLSPRIPRSIYRWRLNDGTFGIQQVIRTDEYFQNGMRTTYAQIPGEKLLILTNEKEGDDITGQSILRPAFKHWQFKDVLYRVQGIAAERYGVGIPVVKLPPAAGEAEKQAGDEMAEEIRSSEKSHIVIRDGWTIDILTPKGNTHGNAIENAIDHHNRMILMACLANFLDLGQGAGSFALSKDQSSFFLKHDDQVAVYLQEQIVEQVLRPLIRLNFGENAEIPKLRHSELGDIDLSSTATTFKTLVDGGLLTVDPELMQFIRKMFKLPELSDEEVTDMQLNELQNNIDDMLDATGQYMEEDNEDATDAGGDDTGVGDEMDDNGGHSQVGKTGTYKDGTTQEDDNIDTAVTN